MTEWISLKDKPRDFERMHFLVDGDSIYISGTRLNPFFFQLCGEIKNLENINWTHWMPLPEPPEKNA